MRSVLACLKLPQVSGKVPVKLLYGIAMELSCSTDKGMIKACRVKERFLPNIVVDMEQSESQKCKICQAALMSCLTIMLGA